MFEGSILKHGEPEELATDEMVRKVFFSKTLNFAKRNSILTSLISFNGDKGNNQIK